ncbi:inositol monophosphatase family protein [Sporosarcina gallistercoris]|uniref:inositol-phosphate phosphatase n=1 Tax=Sporosarcina gallistercoris TaxID=2762245 RepID=A0ABR8PGH2_9BACL|nr:inositol monophosphatase family protein [Sporosarcina gallistercoris]MBD7907259.1 inositol monophosphatase family protein [Sporosarcina gallistercoris]
MNWGALDRYAKSLIKEAAQHIKHSFFTEIEISAKSSANDLVTNIDHEIEQFFIKRIRRDFPEHRIMGEEGFGDDIQSLDGFIWFLDPIDGTMNFVHQKRNFAISLGIYIDGIGMLGYVYDVMADDLYSAMKDEGAFLNDIRLPSLEDTTIEQAIIGVNASWVAPNRYVETAPMIDLVTKCRGTRSYGSAALELTHVAAGRVDAYMSMRLSPWDVAGGIIIANEVGAISSTLTGVRPGLLQQETFVVANKSIHTQLLEEFIVLKK